MNLRTLIIKRFLPFLGVYLFLAILTALPVVRKIYYPVFERFSIRALSGSIEDVYFKPKPKGEDIKKDYNKLDVLFQSKSVLQALMDESKKRGIQAKYSYKGFQITIDETFITPLIFFLSLLIFTPGQLKKKLISMLLGTVLIMGFAYLIVFFKGQFMVNKSGVRDILFSQNDINFFNIMHFIFSSVTIVSVVLLVWILVSFRKSDLKKLFDFNA